MAGEARFGSDLTMPGMRLGEATAHTMQLVNLDALVIPSYMKIAAGGYMTCAGRDSEPERSVAGLVAGLLGLIWCPADFMLVSGEGIWPAWMRP